MIAGDPDPATCAAEVFASASEVQSQGIRFRLLADRALADRLGTEGRRRAEAHDLGVTAARIEQLLWHVRCNSRDHGHHTTQERK